MKPEPTLTVIHAALASGQADYARVTAEHLLEAQPGHLAASVALARTLMTLGQDAAAEAQLVRVLQVDPEDAAAWQVLGELRERHGVRTGAWNAAAAGLVLNPRDRRLHERLVALSATTAGAPPKSAPAWLDALMRARMALEGGRYAEARAEAATTLAYAIDPLPALLQLEAIWRLADLIIARRLAEQLLTQHNRLVKPRLILAECLFAQGTQAERAVAILHEASGLDPAGQVALRLWGENHRFRSLWPAPEPLLGAGPLPAPVAAALGWNQLGPAPVAVAGGAAFDPAARTTEPSWRRGDTVPLPAARQLEASAERARARLIADMLKTINDELARLNRPARRKAPPRAAHVILTSKQRLTEKYGEAGFARIDGLLRRLVAATAVARPELAPGIVYVDDPHSLREFNLGPIDPAHPWAIKSLLADLDAVVRQETRDNGHLGSVLIVGGDDVIPHHRLPNPTEDSDREVLSDNPYASIDDNYFVTERAVGRLPGGDGDPEMLCRAIETAIAAHEASPPPMPFWRKVWLWLRRVLGDTLPPPPPPTDSFGYTAAVWRRASLLVFAAIGNPRRLRVCPPATTADLPNLELARATLAYFNLHGVADGPDWYGQRDPQEPGEGIAFPVALRPSDLNGGAPRVVFSEACYGAAAAGRTPATSLALRFLAEGAQGVVASTAVAYGSVREPLSAADLLGRVFWSELANGFTQGEALQRARLKLAQIMQQRQGALDGEDQKTMISFVLYGDPSARVNVSVADLQDELSHAGPAADETSSPAIVCTKGGTREAVFDAPIDVIAQVKKEVAHYLPGMEGAELRCTRPHTCRGKHSGHACPAQTLGAADERTSAATRDRLVFTLEKTIRTEQHTHARIVRVTTNPAGQMLKMVVSK
jgi:tetratricopeptide (TPR) repeat protein